MVVTYKDWHEMLSFALHSYQIVVKTSTGATLYSLVFGMKAVTALEVEIPSLRVLIYSKLEEAEWEKVRYEQLNLVSKKRIVVIYRREWLKYITRRSNLVHSKEGDLVLKNILALPNKDQSNPTMKAPM